MTICTFLARRERECRVRIVNECEGRKVPEEVRIEAILEPVPVPGIGEGMIPQGGGAVVNVSSIAGQVTLPWLTLYSATKHALHSFGDGLRTELAPHHIHVMTVCPGYVRTRFQQNILAGKAPDLGAATRRWAITPERCADALVKGLERNARTVVTPASGWLLVAMHGLFPGLVDRQFEKIYQRDHREPKA